MIKLLILDVDGVLTDGTKFYNEQHEVLGKRFVCKDFTAIKRFIAAGVTPSICEADPIVSGCDFVSFSTTSFERPDISL